MNTNFSDSVILVTSTDSDYSGNFGTGFIIHQDEQMTYVLTCAHVVKDVGGADKVKAGGHPARVEALGDVYGCDLAVLSVKDGLSKLPLLKLGVVGEQGREFIVSGCYTDGTKTRKLAPISGKLGGTQIIVKEGDRTPSWNLEISDDSEHELKAGYSGSPVVDKASSYVLGVVAQWTGQGKGLAISIEALGKVWTGISSNLVTVSFSPLEQRVNYSESISENSLKSDEIILETQLPASRSLTDSQKQRLEQRQDALQAEWQLTNDKLKQLRKAYAIEVGTAVKFQLQKQIQFEETQLSQLETKLEEIEQNLSPGTAVLNFQTSSEVEIKSLTNIKMIDFNQADIESEIQDIDNEIKHIKALINAKKNNKSYKELSIEDCSANNPELVRKLQAEVKKIQEEIKELTLNKKQLEEEMQKKKQIVNGL
jgi:hypothetical protein